jgi:outer membrane protein TolC
MKFKIMKQLSIILLLTLQLQVFAQDPIDPYLELAAANNPGLKAKFNDFMASLEMIPQARGLTDPRLTFGYFIQPVETRVGAQRASAGLAQTFPWFGTLKAKENVACQVADAKLVAFEDAKLKLFQEVRVAYNEMYYANQAVHLTEENLQVLNSFKELARVNFESGKTGFVSVLRVEMEEEELTARLAFLRDTFASAKKAFENMLNTKLVHEIPFPQTLELATLGYDQQVLADSLIANNLQLKELKYHVQASDDRIKVAEMMARPSFTVGLNYIFVDERVDMDVPENGKNAFLFPQVGMSIPMFKKKYRAMQNQAKLEKERIEFEIESKTNELSSKLEFLVRDYLDGQRRIELFQHLHYLSERSLSLLQTEFITGKTDFEEVLRMDRKLINYQLELEKARVDINNAVHKINYLVGNEKFEN